MRAFVVAADIITPYGTGVDSCWNGLIANKTAIQTVTRFDTRAFQSPYAGIVSGLTYHQGASLVMQMLTILFQRAANVVPRDAKFLLATTKGEIDYLETYILEHRGDPAESIPLRLLKKVAGLSGIDDEGVIISSACTSSSAAVARAAAMIRSGSTDCALVAACDSVTEFIYSGFSSLMALDSVPARPFDKNRAGLNVGEAAGIALLMSEERARREERPVLGEIAGWGLSDDANHMTGPCRRSEGLVLAINKAFVSAKITSDDIGFIGAHGTGTGYNDEMELRGFRKVFGNRELPVYSIKGGIGHTMGAAGLVETIIALRALREKTAPPTVNLQTPDDNARGWVSNSPQRFGSGTKALVTNAGFSGVNTALVLA